MKAALALDPSAVDHRAEPAVATGAISAWRIGAVMFGNELRAYLRNRMAVFWVFLFPLLLYVLLGFAVGNDLGIVRVHVAAAAGDAAAIEAAQRIEAAVLDSRLYRVQRVERPEAADLALAVATRDGVLRVDARHAASRSGALYLTLRAAEQASLEQALRRAGQAGSVRFERQAQAGAVAPLRFDRFLFSGVVVLMMLSGGVLSLAYALAGQREQQVLKPYATWPISPRLYLCGVVGARFVLILLGALLFLAAGEWVFGLQLLMSPARAASALLLLSLGALLFLAIGFCLAARSRSAAMTETLGNAVYYPMLLLGDLTIPLRELPWGLSSVLQWLPTNQIAGGLRLALFEPGPYTWPWALQGGLAAATLAIALLGAAAFRFDNEVR